MRTLYKIQLTNEQRTELEQLIASGTHKARVLARARVLLLADQARADADIAAVLHIGTATVERVRKHFVTAGLARALYGNKSPGRPVHITGDVEAKLVVLACSAPPPGRVRWTLQLLADQMIELHYVDSISDQQVYNMLKKTNLSPGASAAGVSLNRAASL